MKTLFLFVITAFFAGQAFSQYYYKDLVAPTELVKKRALYQANQVRNVRCNSYDNTNRPIEGFSCQQRVLNRFTEIKTVTKDPLSGTTESTSFFDENGRLVKSIDTADGNRTMVQYSYDAAGRVAEILSESVSPGQYISRERHRWFYNEAGKPQRMIKIKNDRDTTTVAFVLDENGNVAEEKSRHRGQALPTVYYYYDDANRITDIVRYNNRAKRLLPDYIFEYNGQNRLETMLVTIEGTGDYQKWYYTYDDSGLKLKDECYSKTKILIGRVEYQYER